MKLFVGLIVAIQAKARSSNICTWECDKAHESDLDACLPLYDPANDSAYYQCLADADAEHKICTDPCQDCHKNCNVEHHEDKIKCDELYHNDHSAHQQCIKDSNNKHHDCNDSCHCVDSCEKRYVQEQVRCDNIGEDPALIELCRDNAWELLDDCMKSNCNLVATSTQAPTTTPEGSGEGSGFDEDLDALFL